MDTSMMSACAVRAEEASPKLHHTPSASTRAASETGLTSRCPSQGSSTGTSAASLHSKRSLSTSSTEPGVASFLEAASRVEGECSSCGCTASCDRSCRFEADFAVTAGAGGELGSGGYCRMVRQAACRCCGRLVAVKTLPSQSDAWMTEVDMFTDLDHPCIVKLEEVYEHDMKAHMVFEKLSGGELFDKVSKEGPLSEEDVAKVTVQVLSALRYLHSRGIVHRDVKLENIMFSGEGAGVKLIDFGLAARMQGGAPLTKRCGTAEYMAPQLFCKEHAGYNEKVDIWALGVVVYKMLMQREMYHGMYSELDPVQKKALARKLKAGDVEFCSSFAANVSQPGQDFVRMLLKKSSECRPSADKALDHPWLKQHAPEAVQRAMAEFSAA